MCFKSGKPEGRAWRLREREKRGGERNKKDEEDYCRSGDEERRKGEWMIMVASGEVEPGLGGCHVREKGKRLGDWKRATHIVIEFLLRLISHIHFIILSSLHATVCCRKCVLISVCMHGARFHGVCLCVYSSRLTVCTVSSCVYMYVLFWMCIIFIIH